MNIGGTGLGLSVSKALIEKMGGKISLVSQKDLGTVFIIEIEAKYEYSDMKPYKYNKKMVEKITRHYN